METLSKDYGLTALSRRAYIGNVKKNDLPELQQELRRLFIGKKDRLFLFMLCTSRRNKKREELQQLLPKLAGYVDANCGNDLAVLLSSGFAARREPLLFASRSVERSSAPNCSADCRLRPRL